MKRKKLKLTLWMIIKRGHYLYFFYYWIYGIVQDYLISGKSMNNTIFNSRENAYPVQCISYPYMKELVAAMEWSEKDVFIDVGSAWGRLLGYMDKYTSVGKIYGVELNKAAADFAKKLFEKSEKVTVIEGDILENMPLDGTVFFLFNPFSSEILDAFLTNVEMKYKHRIKLMYLYPTCREVLDKHREKWFLIEEKAIKPRYLGELQMCIYEFLP